MTKRKQDQIAQDAHKLFERLAGAKAEPDWITFEEAESEIAKAFALSAEAPMMMLFGLIAIGRVRAADHKQRVIDNSERKPEFISEGDLRHWLRDQSDVPTNKLDLVISKLIKSGLAPWRGGNIRAKEFCDRVRDKLGGRWVGKAGKQTVTDRHIRRRIKALRPELG
jgi:hypothetical protein